MTLYCSFCGKSEHDEPITLIAGPGVNICKECIALCTQTISTFRKTQMTPDQIHEIARLAAEAAGGLNSMILHGVTTALPTPKAGAEAVVDAYLAAVKKLRDDEQPAAVAVPAV